jgi:8-oxo-dGTP pyrophosphatase MutT (NUDIX family)
VVTASQRPDAGRTVHAKHRLGAAAVILDERGRVLLVRHTYGRLNWELPGGAAEPNESIVQTALREVQEETGLQVTARHTSGIYYEPENDMLHFVFLCEPQDGDLEPRPRGWEISACAFWPPNDLPRPISDFTVRRIEHALSGVVWPLPETVGKRRWLF